MNSSLQIRSSPFKPVQAKQKRGTERNAKRKFSASLSLLAAMAAAAMVTACGGGDTASQAPAVGDTHRLQIQATPADVPRLGGAWEAPFDMGIVAVHMALQPDGRVLYFGSKVSNRDQSAIDDFGVFDWRAATPSERVQLLPNLSGSDLFCSGVSLDPLTGRTLIVGGDQPNGLPDMGYNVANNNGVTYDPARRATVSYTHLTLPTILRV